MKCSATISAGGLVRARSLAMSIAYISKHPPANHEPNTIAAYLPGGQPTSTLLLRLVLCRILKRQHYQRRTPLNLSNLSNYALVDARSLYVSLRLLSVGTSSRINDSLAPAMLSTNSGP